jgi:glycosyltransferase involved in cell wall biosynthesis
LLQLTLQTSFNAKYAESLRMCTLIDAYELIKRGHVVHVFSGHPSSANLKEEERFDEYDFEGIHVYRFHHAYTPMAGQESLIEVGYNNRLSVRFFDGILKDFKPDIVHFFHLNRLGTALIEQAVHAKIPAFLTPTDFWTICPTGQLVLDDGKLCSGPSNNGGNCVKHLALSKRNDLVGSIMQRLPIFLMDFLVRLTLAEILPHYPHQIEIKATGLRLTKNIARLNMLSKIISPNSFMTEKLLQYGVLPELIHQTAFGIDLPKLEATNLQRVARKPLRVGFIGTLAPHKGCHVIIKAFNALPYGQAVLKIYGNPQDFPEYSSELTKLANNSKAIEFCGTFHNSKIGEVLADIDVLVLPSLWYENTPLVVYSAQAALCPVVASDFPGISEVIQDQINGLLFEAGNVESLTKQLCRLMDESNLLSQLSINAMRPKSTVSYTNELLNIWKTNE